jgi:hypothetical protein
MALVNDPNVSTAATGITVTVAPPYAINREWCLGDSLFFINKNFDNVDTRITTANTNITNLNTAVVATSSFAGSSTAKPQFFSLGVGTAASNTQGEIRATNNITAYFTSDIRLKKNITTIDNALEKIQQIAGVEYDWKNEYIESAGGEDGFFIRKHDVGVIAQDVQKILPEVVAERSDGLLAVKYDRIVPLLIEAIKELSREVEVLKSKIKE